MSFEGKVALATGGSSGIGRATALRLAADGCAVGALDLGREAAEQVASQARQAGGRALALTADVPRRTT